ncbi:MAG: bifunctional UDP-4-keto-pentose/UDP-xylose synthase, partial [Nitrospirota bacterium]|nr:bifunctional UDP-4-keto-pentose/UDP-xylose synthase [Nitrospirota bacterium]
MAIIENPNRITSGQIYNIGNPANQYSVRELGEMMVALALEYLEYAKTASKVQFVDVSSSTYYGEGYQDVQHRVPAIENTCRDLNWHPKTTMDQMLRLIFNSYRSEIAEARALLE